MHLYEVRPRKDKRSVDLISDALPFGRLWYGEPNAVSNAIGYAMHHSRSDDAVIRVYDEAGNVIETHEHKGDFKEWRRFSSRRSPAHRNFAESRRKRLNHEAESQGRREWPASRVCGSSSMHPGARAFDT
jgi:hypothetical protein